MNFKISAVLALIFVSAQTLKVENHNWGYNWRSKGKHERALK